MDTRSPPPLCRVLHHLLRERLPPSVLRARLATTAPASCPSTCVFFIAITTTFMVAPAERDVGPERRRAPLAQTSVGWVSPPLLFRNAWPSGSTFPGARPLALPSASLSSLWARRCTRLDVLHPLGRGILTLGSSQKEEVGLWATGTCFMKPTSPPGELYGPFLPARFCLSQCFPVDRVTGWYRACVAACPRGSVLVTCP